jgi:hypothetical protein
LADQHPFFVSTSQEFQTHCSTTEKTPLIPILLPRHGLDCLHGCCLPGAASCKTPEQLWGGLRCNQSTRFSPSKCYAANPSKIRIADAARLGIKSSTLPATHHVG